jgi:hypothetical protein
VHLTYNTLKKFEMTKINQQKKCNETKKIIAVIVTHSKNRANSSESVFLVSLLDNITDEVHRKS